MVVVRPITIGTYDNDFVPQAGAVAEIFAAVISTNISNTGTAGMCRAAHYSETVVV